MPAGRHVVARLPHQIERPEPGAVGRRRVRLIDAADLLAILDDAPVGEVRKGT
jgi:hypothetical protein